MTEAIKPLFVGDHLPKSFTKTSSLDISFMHQCHNLHNNFRIVQWTELIVHLLIASLACCSLIFSLHQGCDRAWPEIWEKIPWTYLLCSYVRLSKISPKIKHTCTQIQVFVPVYTNCMPLFLPPSGPCVVSPLCCFPNFMLAAASWKALHIVISEAPSCTCFWEKTVAVTATREESHGKRRTEEKLNKELRRVEDVGHWTKDH